MSSAGLEIGWLLSASISHPRRTVLRKHSRDMEPIRRHRDAFTSRAASLRATGPAPVIDEACDGRPRPDVVRRLAAS